MRFAFADQTDVLARPAELNFGAMADFLARL